MFSMDSVVGMEMCFLMMVEEDMIADYHMNTLFTLSVANSNDRVGENGTHNLTVIDNDGKELWFVLLPP